MKGDNNMNYPFYNNNQFYVQELQNMKDRIDNQLRQVQQSQVQQQIPQPITQNFQLATNPTNNELESKYAENIEQVKNTFVIKTGLFINKDFNTLWVKDVTGKIKTYSLEEIIEMDDKDKEILDLKKQIKEMKGLIANGYDDTNVIEPVKEKKSTRVQNSKRSNAK